MNNIKNKIYDFNFYKINFKNHFKLQLIRIKTNESLSIKCINANNSIIFIDEKFKLNIMIQVRNSFI